MRIKKTDSVKFVTDTVRFAYVNLDKTQPPSIPGGTFKYSIQIVIDKTNAKEIERINKAVDMVKEKLPKGAKGGLLDGHEEGTLILNISSMEMPNLVDANLNPILDHNEIYEGCTGRVSVTVFPYSVSGSVGVGFGLNSIMKQADGERPVNKATLDFL